MTQALTTGPVFAAQAPDLSNRTMPFSLDAERALLGALMMNGKVWSEAASVIVANDFYRDAHRRIYGAMERLHERGTELDYITVKDALVASGEFDECGGSPYLIGLTDGVPRSAHAEAYALIVAEKSRLRETVMAANAMAAAAYDADKSCADVIDDGVRALLSMAGVGRSKAPVSVEDAVMSYLKGLDTPDERGTITTGYHDVDELLTGGLRRRELTIVAARPSAGKTSFALGVSRAAARSGVPTVFFTVEMSVEALAGREVAQVARVSSERLQRRALAEQDWPRITAAYGQVQIPLVFYEDATTLTQVAAWCHRLKQRPEGLGLAVVDYLQLLSHAGARSREQEISAISRGLARVAKEQDIAMVALSQLSRAPEQRSDKRPHLSDLRESGALEQDAAVVMLLFREEMHNPTDSNQGVAEVIIAKQRNGPTGVVKLVFLKDLAGKFDNMSEGA